MKNLSQDDMDLLVQFLRWTQEHKDDLEGYNRTVPIEGYVLAACITLLSFDYVCTFTREVKYVWTSPWSLGLPLFYVNRYIPFIDISLFMFMNSNHMSSPSCNVVVKTATWLISFSSFFAQLIIVLRTCALWGKRRAVVYSMTLLMLATAAITTYLTSKTLTDLAFAPTPSFIAGCLMAQGLTDSLYIYVTLFIGELIIVVLTIIKAFQHLRRKRQSVWLPQLYKNGIFYCVCILLFTLVNIVGHLSSLPYVYKQCLRLPQHVFHSIFCNRVMLQIQQYRHDLQDGALHRSGTRRGVHSTDSVDTHDIFTTVIVSTKPTEDIEMTETTLSTAVEKRAHGPDQWVQ